VRRSFHKKRSALGSRFKAARRVGRASRGHDGGLAAFCLSGVLPVGCFACQAFCPSLV
jgi:hypothetical protein